jgi:MFS family permease
MSTLIASIILPVRRHIFERGAVKEHFWHPLRQGTFLAFFSATLVAGIGMSATEITSTWLMTELTRSPLMISLVTTALSLPAFLLALPAGVLSDILDRRRLLLFTEGMLSVTMALAALLVLWHLITPVVLLMAALLIGTFSMGRSTVMNTILPHVVARRDFSAAIALTTLRYHISRAIGGIVGGLLIVGASMGHAFVACAFTPLAMILFLWGWHPPQVSNRLPAEKGRAALRTGLRYLWYAPALSAVLVRLIAFVGAGSAMWALLPVFARHYLGLTALHYGTLFSVFGVGAMIGSAGAFRLGKASSDETVMGISTIGFAVALYLITTAHTVTQLGVVLFFAGLTWSGGMVCLKTAVQTAAPDWVRGRVSSVFTLALHGSIAVGSALWGLVAWYDTTPNALAYAAVAMAITAALAIAFRLRVVPAVIEDHQTAKFAPFELPEAVVAASDPLMIALEYQIAPERASEFERLMHEIGHIRRRGGATFWGLFSETVLPGIYLEYFTVECALDALRMHDRMTDPERETLGRARSLHRPGRGPAMHHHRRFC